MMMCSRFLSCVFALTLASPMMAGPPDPPGRVEVSFNRFYDYDGIVDVLQRLQRGYPDLVTLESIGKSTQGRDMWMVMINNPRTGSDRSKSAIYIDANVHGNEVQGSETCLYTIWYLTKNYGVIDKITELVDQRAFYILPMVNPDGRAYWFNEPNTPHSSRTGQKPTDNDYDGLYDEDGPDDLDGDGFITRMWKKDPHGRYRRSKKDPRIIERVPADETGDYTSLGQEGIDNDGDGRINEDGPGGYDMNRNWPSDWQPNHIQYGAGDYPFSYPETASIGRFLVDHPNVAAVQSYHNAGGMILRGPGATARESEYPAGDLRVYKKLGKTGEDMLPFYRYLVINKDLYDVHGGFVNWVYEGLGIFSFTNELWTASQFFGKKEGRWFGLDADRRMKFGDLLQFGHMYRELKPYNHPLYGEIEIGGWTQYSSRVPPTFMLEELCHRNTAFTLYHADQMPLLEFIRSDVVSLGSDVWQVTVEIKNKRLLPTTSARAADKKIGPRDSVVLAAANDSSRVEVLGSGTLENRYNASLVLTEHQPYRIWVDKGIPGHRSRIYRWIVRGSGSVTVTFRGAKTADVSQSLRLRESAP
jgi:Zinc carboxypeptidase